MKIRYPVIGIIVLFISASIWESIIGTDTFAEVGHPIFVILFVSLLGLIVYLVAKSLFNEIGDLMGDAQRHFAHKERRREEQAYTVHSINQELDEIEASLDAVSSNDKVTPIWGGQPPKKP